MRILLVSNGHGEDVMAAAVGRALRAHDLTVEAVPLIGRGAAYDTADIAAHGPRRSLPSGGYTLRGPARFAADLRAGLIPATWGAWRALRRGAAAADAAFVVGDPYAISVAAALGPSDRYYLPSAVSVMAWPLRTAPWEQPYGPLERRLMRGSRRVYPRDAASGAWLQAHGVANVRDLGNPMLDAVTGDVAPDRSGPYLLLLPGTREDRWLSLPRMLDAAARLGDLPLQPVVAWAGDDPPPDVPGWRWEATGRTAGTVARYRRSTAAGEGAAVTVDVARGSFAVVLRGARVALSTSGTAAEQCAGFGVPIVGFVTGGPQYTAGFAAGQKRALGAALELVEPEPDAIAAAARTLDGDASRRARARADGRTAMGVPGAAARIAADVADDVLGLRSATMPHHER